MTVSSCNVDGKERPMTPYLSHEKMCVCGVKLMTDRLDEKYEKYIHLYPFQLQTNNLGTLLRPSTGDDCPNAVVHGLVMDDGAAIFKWWFVCIIATQQLYTSICHNNAVPQ